MMRGNNVKTEKFNSFDWVIYKLLLFFFLSLFDLCLYVCLWIHSLFFSFLRNIDIAILAFILGTRLYIFNRRPHCTWNDFMHSVWAFSSQQLLPKIIRRFQLLHRTTMCLQTTMFIVFHLPTCFHFVRNKWIPEATKKERERKTHIQNL